MNFKYCVIYLQAEDTEGKLKCLEKEYEELRGKLAKEEAKRKELDIKLTQSKTSSSAAASTSKTKKAVSKPPRFHAQPCIRIQTESRRDYTCAVCSQDEKSSGGGPGKVSDFRAKFEKFGTTAGRRPSLSKLLHC